MHVVSAFLVAYLGIASAKSSPKPDTGVQHDGALEMYTDEVLYRKPMADFVYIRNHRIGPEHMIWEANGCNRVADRPSGFDFKNACNRHDFGIRNFKYQKRLTKDSKRRIDENFRNDMIAQCRVENGSKDLCLLTAELYYDGVRIFGRRSVGGRVMIDTVLDLEDRVQTAEK